MHGNKRPEPVPESDWEYWKWIIYNVYIVVVIREKLVRSIIMCYVCVCVSFTNNCFVKVYKWKRFCVLNNHKYIVCVGYLFWNQLVVDPNSKWYWKHMTIRTVFPSVCRLSFSLLYLAFCLSIFVCLVVFPSVILSQSINSSV